MLNTIISLDNNKDGERYYRSKIKLIRMDNVFMSQREDATSNGSLEGKDSGGSTPSTIRGFQFPEHTSDPPRTLDTINEQD